MDEATMNTDISATKSPIDTFVRMAEPPSNKCPRGKNLFELTLLHRIKMTA